MNILLLQSGLIERERLKKDKICLLSQNGLKVSNTEKYYSGEYEEFY